MKTTRASPFLVRTVLLAGLLALAGTCCEMRPALAQLDCPLPPGVSSPPQPSVTAQQVENGSASLRDFAREAKRHAGRTISSQDELSHDVCHQRQEGGPWRSGTTYIVKLLPDGLSPDGRVLIHSKDMSLSGGLLKREIYEAILQALGIDPADITDPSAARTALNETVAADVGRFDVPGFPGASGYAAVYRSDYFGNPRVMLVGFDLDRSHLVNEDIDHPQPAVAAQDVVDRTSLQTFVTKAGHYFLRHRESADLAALARSRVAFRDPDGPWRHGSVYLAVLDPGTRVILFHGAFPDRFELRQAGISRDAATGELIADQLIAAANNSPEGGFWLYHFDDPDDEFHGVEVPKVGYARLFTGSIALPDGTTRPTSFIINSGFYLTSDGVFVRRILEALGDGEPSIMFGLAEPGDGHVVSGDAVTVSVGYAPTDTVHFAYRLAGAPEEGFTWLGAAANRDEVATFAWDTLDLPDDDYELFAFVTEDDGYSVTYDVIEVSVDNTGDGGCAALPVPPEGPVDPTLALLVGFLTACLVFRRRRLEPRAGLG